MIIIIHIVYYVLEVAKDMLAESSLEQISRKKTHLHIDKIKFRKMTEKLLDQS